MRRRRIWIAAGVLIFALLLAGAIYLRKIAAPETARILPEAEGFLYVNLAPFRLVSDFGGSPITISRDSEYEAFVQATGFHWERDLDEMAIAVHPPELTQTPFGVRPQRRFSEVFKARFDAGRLNHYLHKLASGVEKYRNFDVFSIPYEGRIVRVSILSVNLVAASNANDAAIIRGMIDRHLKIALPFGGPRLVSDHYRHVPLGSSAWAILSLPSAEGRGTTLPLPNGVEFQLPAGAVTVASVRYVGAVQFRAEAFTANEADARQLADSLTNFLQLFRAVETNVQPSGPDPDVKAFFDSLKVEQRETRAVLMAELPQGFIRKALSEPPATAPEKPAAPKTKAKSKTK